MKTKQTAFRVPEDIKLAAQKKAKTQRRSLANYVLSLMAADLGTMVQEAAEELEEKGKANLAKAKKAVKYTGRQPKKKTTK